MLGKKQNLNEEIIDISNIDDEDILQILSKEVVKIQNEITISKLVYSYHDCDSYEDLFRDNIPLLEDKKNGIQIAIRNLQAAINQDDVIDEKK